MSTITDRNARRLGRANARRDFAKSSSRWTPEAAEEHISMMCDAAEANAGDDPPPRCMIETLKAYALEFKVLLEKQNRVSLSRAGTLEKVPSRADRAASRPPTKEDLAGFPAGVPPCAKNSRPLASQFRPFADC